MTASAISQFFPQLKENEALDSLSLQHFFEQPLLNAFDPAATEFVYALSNAILQEPGVGQFPELTALGYWLRKSNIRKMQNEFLSAVASSEVVVPRGVAFHVAPANVDSIFLYSWCLSLLAGNSNIVRVTQKTTEQLELLLAILRRTIGNPEFHEVRDRNIVLTYPHDESINAYFSANADIRVMWGGDETIRSIRKLPAKPTTKEIAFADKVSLSVIDSEEYLRVHDDKRAEIGKKFYNDAYWFNQAACSSPRIVYFSGTPETNENASREFWKAVECELNRRSAIDSMAVAMNKLTFAFELCAVSGTDIELKKIGNAAAPSVVRVPLDRVGEFRQTCGDGLFYECLIGSLTDLTGNILPNDQTMTYFGFSGDALKDFVGRLRGKGIDRIVPFGQALQFGPIWDGYDLLRELTKQVTIL